MLTSVKLSAQKRLLRSISSGLKRSAQNCHYCRSFHVNFSISDVWKVEGKLCAFCLIFSLFEGSAMFYFPILAELLPINVAGVPRCCIKCIIKSKFHSSPAPVSFNLVLFQFRLKTLRFHFC